MESIHASEWGSTGRRSTGTFQKLSAGNNGQPPSDGPEPLTAVICAVSGAWDAAVAGSEAGGASSVAETAPQAIVRISASNHSEARFIAFDSLTERRRIEEIHRRDEPASVDLVQRDGL